MSSERYDYPEDEFDVAGRERGPRGSHRRPRTLWRTLLPFLVVIVAAPLIAWGAVSLLSGGDDDPTPSAQPTASAPAEETTAPEDEATAEPPAEEETTEPAAEPTEEETTAEEETTEPADVDYTATISVLNGAGVSGLAGSAVEQLAAAGFTNGVAANYDAAAPQGTTLYYNNAELAATAQAVAQTLGIASVVESASATTSVDIAIVLRGDFAG